MNPFCQEIKQYISIVRANWTHTNMGSPSCKLQKCLESTEMHLDWSFNCNQPMAHQYAVASTHISKLWQETQCEMTRSFPRTYHSRLTCACKRSLKLSSIKLEVFHLINKLLVHMLCLKTRGSQECFKPPLNLRKPSANTGLTGTYSMTFRFQFILDLLKHSSLTKHFVCRSAIVQLY